MLLKYQEFFKLYEFHPGSISPYESILIKINKAISQGADKYALKNTIKELLDFQRGQGSGIKFRKDSIQYKYVQIISDAIETSLDDGYPENWIIKDLEKIYNEMK